MKPGGVEMPKYKIGITEAGDAGLDLSWVNKLDTVDGAIVITKNITIGFYNAVIEHKDKLIVHATVTGYGDSILESNVPHPALELGSITKLVEGGFPKNKVVIRVDPIIPTKKGIETALRVIKAFMDDGFSRFRVSIIDMYPHVRERFKAAGLPLPYGEFGFYPSSEQVKAVDRMLLDAEIYWSSLGDRTNTCGMLMIESCAEPGLTNAAQCGCISSYDLCLLGLDDELNPDSYGFQRKNCLCYSGKTELLEHKKRCRHKCLYCYWR